MELLLMSNRPSTNAPLPAESYEMRYVAEDLRALIVVMPDGRRATLNRAELEKIAK